MSTKSQVLTLLMKQAPTFISGEEMAQELSLSRTAIWKAINELKKKVIKFQAAAIKAIGMTLQTYYLPKGSNLL